MPELSQENVYLDLTINRQENHHKELNKFQSEHNCTKAHSYIQIFQTFRLFYVTHFDKLETRFKNNYGFNPREQSINRFHQLKVISVYTISKQFVSTGVVNHLLNAVNSISDEIGNSDDSDSYSK